jgi:hypothetical protein
MIAIVPKDAWHRVLSEEGGTTFSATLPGKHIDIVADIHAHEGTQDTLDG